MPEILILGTGAMASLFGARLAATGKEVALLGTWAEAISTMRKKGILLTSDQTGDYYQVQAEFSIDQIQQVEMALVLVKSWQTRRAAQQLRELLGPDGVALTLQNGLGNVDILREFLSAERAAAGVTTTGATLLGPGRVRPGGEGVISVQEHLRLGPLVSILEEAGFTVEVVKDLDRMIWEKLIINSAINPLTALLGVTNGRVLDSSSARAVMAAAAEETYQVADALGVAPDFGHPYQVVEQVAKRTAGNCSSMLQDVRRGAPTEIDAINGQVENLGKKCRVSTPVNGILTKLIKAQVDLSG